MCEVCVYRDGWLLHIWQSYGQAKPRKANVTNNTSIGKSQCMHEVLTSTWTLYENIPPQVRQLPADEDIQAPDTTLIKKLIPEQPVISDKVCCKKGCFCKEDSVQTLSIDKEDQVMFKRPRSHKESVLASQSNNKRLKEDCGMQVRSRTQEQQEDYINLTYPHKHSARDRGTESALQCQEDAMIAETAEGYRIDQGRTEGTRYNQLKLQQGGSRYEPHLLRSCAYECDSDTSSIASSITSSIASEATEGSSGPDSIEREHYNKLKVDVNQIQTNKKLLKGVKILHTQDNSHTGFNTSSPQRKLTANVVGMDYLKPHYPTKYRKEGHANQLHSVSRAFHSLQNPTKSSSLLPKSKSTGDILQMTHDMGTARGLTHEVGTARVGYNNVPRHRLTHSKSTHDMESVSESNSTMSTSDSYSTGRNGASRPPPPGHCSSTELSFINKMINFSCAHEGKEIRSTAYDFAVNIRKGTVRKRKSIAFNVGVCLHGPFSFPSDYRLVSPILMVTSPTHNKLRKSIEVVLSHCIDIGPQTGKNVSFFRARKMRKNGLAQNYHFEPTDSDTNHFEIHDNHGKLSSTELGFFCIMIKEVVDTRRKTNYCLVPVIPKHVEPASWKVHYCVTLHLQAFVKVSLQGMGVQHTSVKLLTL